MSTSLNLVFKGTSDEKLSWTFPYADPAASAVNVKALMQGMIASGDIYTAAPVSMVSADLVVRTTTPVDLS